MNKMIIKLTKSLKMRNQPKIILEIIIIQKLFSFNLGIQKELCDI